MSGKAAIAAAKRRRAGVGSIPNSRANRIQLVQGQNSNNYQERKIHVTTAVEFLGKKFTELQEVVIPSIVNETNNSIGVITSNLESLKDYILEDNNKNNNEDVSEKLKDLENNITSLKLLILENKNQNLSNKNELALIKKQLNQFLDSKLLSDNSVHNNKNDVNESDLEENLTDKENGDNNSVENVDQLNEKPNVVDSENIETHEENSENVQLEVQENNN